MTTLILRLLLVGTLFPFTVALAQSRDNSGSAITSSPFPCTGHNLPWNDAQVESLRQQGAIAGLQIAVVSNNRCALKKYGENGTQANQDLLRIASVSKTFIATLFFKLAKIGKIRITDTIGQYLDPSLLPFIDFTNVKMSDLLRHSSGIPDYFTDAFIQFILQNPDQIKTEQDALNAVKSLPSLFAPGSQISYSNTNYVLLGLILDKIAAEMGSRDHSVLLRNYVLEPIGLQSTYYEVKEAGLYDPFLIVSGFQDGTNYLHVQQGYGLANGGLLATIEDVARFFDALFNLRDFAAIGREMMPIAGSNFGYGLYTLDPRKEFVGYTGEFAGYLTFAAHNSTNNTTIIGFSDDSSQKAKDAFTQIQNALYSSLDH